MPVPWVIKTSRDHRRRLGLYEAAAAAADNGALCTFNDTNGVALDAYSWSDPADVRPNGNQWVEQSGTLFITSNWLDVSGWTRQRATLDCGLADGVLTLTVNPTKYTGGETGLLFRYQDNSNFWVAEYAHDAQVGYQVSIVQYVANVRNRRDYDTLDYTEAPHTIQVTLNGSSIVALFDGANQCTYNSATGATSTLHGAYTNKENQLFNDFQMVPL